AELAPVVEVLRLAADIKQAVDGARSAQHLAARLDDAAVVELRLRPPTVEPGYLGICGQVAVAEREMDPDVAIAGAGLDQQHAMAARGGQAVRQDAASAPGADDDVVERCCVPHFRLPPGWSADLDGRSPRCSSVATPKARLRQPLGCLGPGG